MSDRTAAERVHDVLIMGAGFGGLHALHRLRGDGFDVLAFEAGADTGGAWYWNNYPGARCDVESLVYCYSFSPVIDAEWRWTERYAARDEICRYLQWVATRLDLRRDIRFGTRIVAARYDTGRSLWQIETEHGDTFLGRHFVSSPGPISKPIPPNVPGLDAFEGEMIHTARWPDPGPAFAGKRVGVIGTGSSGTQLIPIVAEQCAQMVVFMRTRNYYLPARNRPLTDEDHAWWAEHRDEIRTKLDKSEIFGSGDLMLSQAIRDTQGAKISDLSPAEFERIMAARWEHGGAQIGYAFRDLYASSESNARVSNWIRGKVGTFVHDPELARRLEPGDFPFGTKRATVGSGYYETFERSNVELVDVLASPIERATAKGIVVDGTEYEIDILILASGFDAVTGALTTIDVRGASGRSLKERWHDGTETYLGISLEDLPNFYMIGGPGSPSVLTNVVRTNEFQVNWIADLLCTMRDKGHTVARVVPDAQKDWTARVEEAVSRGVWTQTDSWYVGTNVPGKKAQVLAYTGGMLRYQRACNAERDAGFPSFSFS
ncbi:MAG: NAD(P)/FAD-dependent oxidoreductase [Gammaproteobacteria bacterium]|nr:NAD(P)/FAD-dependent oxidoreductase [Gammaproteobacteria bacterium]